MPRRRFLCSARRVRAERSESFVDDRRSVGAVFDMPRSLVGDCPRSDDLSRCAMMIARQDEDQRLRHYDLYARSGICGPAEGNARSRFE